MPTYLCGTLMLVLPSALHPIRQEIFAGFLTLIFLVTFILPAINIFIFKIFGTIQSFTMEERRDRVVPFIFITVLYLLMTYFFHTNFRIGIQESLLKLLLIVDVLVITSTVITFFYRISIHSISICGLLGILIPLNKISEDNQLFYPTIACIVIAGVVMSSRLQLQAHTQREVLLGATIGYAAAYFSMLFLF